MKVMNNKPQIYHYTPSFKSTRVRQLDELGNVVYCHYSNFNREDTDWKKLAQFLGERFKNQDRVKINIYGCSDFSDGYTLVMNLFKELGNKAKKFFPILGSDLSKSIIQENSQGKILLHKKDLEFIEQMGMSSMFERDYHKPTQIMRGIEFYPHKVKPQLRDTVEFSIKDVRQDTLQHDFSDEVMSFRNGWGYNTLEEQEQIVQSLQKNSNDKTLVMIGQSDLFKSGASDAFQRNGFRGIQSDVFAAGETNYPSALVGTPSHKPIYPEFILFEKVKADQRGIYV